MSDKKTPQGGTQGDNSLALIQQYGEQVIRMAGAQRLFKMVHEDRVKAWGWLTALLTNFEGISSPEVKDAALELSKTPGEGLSDRFNRLAEAIVNYRPEAESKGEGEALASLEKMVLKLIHHYGDLLKKELKLQEEEMYHRAEALRIKNLQDNGDKGVH